MSNNNNQKTNKMKNPKQYFEELVKGDATKLKRAYNQLRQRVDYVEHPIHGDEYPVIAMFPDQGVAFNTTFFDCGDFYRGSDYNSCFVDGKHLCAFEL